MSTSVPVQEAKISFRGYFTWYQIVGESQPGKYPLLVLHGGPGFPTVGEAGTSVRLLLQST